MITDIPCVILAGGKSSRMGADKALLPFGKYDSLAEFQFQKFSKIFEKVYISTKYKKFNFDHKQIIDSEENFSPMIALRNIITFLRQKYVFIIAVDYPFIKESSIKILLESKQNGQIVIAKTSQTHNLCGIYSLDSLNKIDKLLAQNNHKISDLIKTTEARIIPFADHEEFVNLNYQKDYETAKSKLQDNF